MRLALRAGSAQEHERLAQVLREELQRDKAMKLRVFGLIHHTHPTTAEFLNDAVVRDGLADHVFPVLPRLSARQ